MGRVLCLISSKGGSGKSTVAVGLATAFSNAGKSVLLIDADEGARCLDTMLSVDKDTVFDISDVLNGSCDIGAAALKVPSLKGVSVVPSPLSGEPIELSGLSKVAHSVKDDYDYVIIDTKGQLPARRLVGICATAEVFSIATPDPIALRNTGVLNGALKASGIKTRLIINRFKTKMPDGKTASVDKMVDTASARLIGIVPEDKRVAAAHGSLKVGTAAAALFRTAARIDGNPIPLPSIKNIL